jgi:thioredoxin-dependent peroxiredoxin
MSRTIRLFLFTCLSTVLVSIGVQADDSTLKVKEGDKFPDFTLQATQIDKVLPDSKAKELSLKDLVGKKNIVIFFYPRANTKGCTIESCGFRDIVDQFAELDTVVIGASSDNLAAQEKFTQDHMLKTPLLADEDMKLIKALGIVNGKAAKRFTFVINKKGEIAKIYEKVSVGTHPKEVWTFVKENLKS